MVTIGCEACGKKVILSGLWASYVMVTNAPFACSSECAKKLSHEVVYIP